MRVAPSRVFAPVPGAYADLGFTHTSMPDSTQPKTPPAEPHTESSEKESIRKSQEEFVGDEAEPSRDRSEVAGSPDHGSRSSDRAVEDGELNNLAADTGVADDEDDQENPDDTTDEDLDTGEEENFNDEDDESDLDEAVADEELTDDETETSASGGQPVVAA